MRLHLFLIYCTTTINVVAKTLDWSLGRIYNCDSSKIRQFQLKKNCLTRSCLANRKEKKNNFKEKLARKIFETKVS